MTRRFRRSIAALITASLLALGVVTASPAAAASFTWNGNAGSTWSSAASWTPNGPPTSGDVLTFPTGASSLSNQNNLPNGTILTLNFTGAGYIIGGVSVLDPQAITQGVAGLNQIFTPITGTIGNLPVTVAAGGTLALNGPMGGPFSLTKAGAGTLVLGGQSFYTGGTVVGAGSLIVNGSINGSQTLVQSGVLGGSGSTLGVTATAGTISPGDNGAGILTVNGALALNAGVTVSLDILGAAQGTLHDALRVTNGVSLANATLALVGTFLGPTNQTFTIIDNTSASAISGTFLNLPEGAVFTAANGVSYRITYVGGTGNDVVLTQSGKSPIRLEGPDRIDTAIAVSKSSFPTAGSANAVVLARGDLFPDALAGAPLAVNKQGPLLLTASGALDPRTLAEIQRVLTPGKNLFVLGGEVAISQAIFNQLQTLGYLVTRLGGADRFETAVVIASNGLGNPATILLATGLNFPDALSGGAAAAKVSGAILLTNGTTQAAATSAYLASRASATVFALGGPAAAAQPSASAIIGVDRYATAVQVAQRFFVSPNPANVGLASGTNFPDGLTGGAHIGKLAGPLLLSDPNALPAVVNTYLVGINSTITGAFIYGGPAAISANVATQYRTAIGG